MGAWSFPRTVSDQKVWLRYLQLRKLPFWLVALRDGALCVLNICAMSSTAMMLSNIIGLVPWTLQQDFDNARRLHRKRFRALKTISPHPHGFCSPPPTGPRASRTQGHSHTPSLTSRSGRTRTQERVEAGC